MSKHDRVQRIRHDQIVRMRQEAQMTFNELARREMRVISRAQSRRFRAVKWLVIGAAFAFLWLRQDPSTAALALFVACFLGVCLHVFLRWKTEGWTKAWGLYTPVPVDGEKAETTGASSHASDEAVPAVPSHALQAHAFGSVVIRAGRSDDQASVDDLIAGERVNPNDNHAPNFLLAIDSGAVIGAVQLRRHADGARELSSLVVRASHRGRGVSTVLVDAILANEAGDVLVVTGRRRVGSYWRRGFVSAAFLRTPRSIQVNRVMGQIFGSLNALAHGRSPQRLVVLRRPARSGISRAATPLTQET
ncbi:MAG: GNAT family N-acetyltransferase [Bosea sp. (in: a-proteobacteria)]